MLKSSQEISAPTDINSVGEQDIRTLVLGKTEEILAILKNNEEVTQEILKSVRFIKSYYFWQTVFNFLKIVILVGIIILGIVSWNSITGLISTGMRGYIGTQIPGALDSNTINQFLR